MTIVITVDYFRYKKYLKNKDLENGIGKILNDFFPNINCWDYNNFFKLPPTLEDFIVNVILAIIEKKNKIYSSSFKFISNNFCIILKEVNDG